MKKIKIPFGYFSEINYEKNLILKANNKDYKFKFRIKTEEQNRAFDDKSRYSGMGFTIYVLNAPSMDSTRFKSQYHFYNIGEIPSICWNRRITSNQDANAIMFAWAQNYLKEYLGGNVYKNFKLPTGTFRKIPKSFFIRKDVLIEIEKTIGKIKPETGGILGTSNGDVIDTFVFDERANVTETSYTPNTSFLENIINEDWYEKGIYFLGFIHSHPYPSIKPSLDDIEYSKRIIDALELDFLFLPIINSNYDGEFQYIFHIVDKHGNLHKCELIVLEEYENENTEIFDFNQNNDFLEHIDGDFGNQLVEINNQVDIFSRISAFYDLNYLSESTLIVVGTGGSRNFCIDMARMGIGNFVLMDGDTINQTNIATQHALIHEIGQFKTDVIAQNIFSVNPKANVLSISKYLEDSIDDLWIERNLFNFKDKKNVVLCAFTDDFKAQARLNRVSQKYQIPFISAQHHQYGLTSEVIYWYPKISNYCMRCYLGNRYEHHLANKSEKISSEGSLIFNTNRLNDLCLKIAFGMLYYNYNKTNRYSNFLLEHADMNLILIKQSHLNKSDEFFNVFTDFPSVFFDFPLWIDPLKTEITKNCPDCSEIIVDSRI